MTTEKRTRVEEDYTFIDEGPSDLIPGQRFGIQVKSPALLESKTPFQFLQVFDSVAHGRVLVLDHVVQLTESDEFAYHEMIAHVPLQIDLGTQSKKKILLIGAGDGGVLRELVKHDNVRSFIWKSCKEN